MSPLSLVRAIWLREFRPYVTAKLFQWYMMQERQILGNLNIRFVIFQRRSSA